MSGFDYSMLGGRVLCAVSGGADSVYLLHRCLEGAAGHGYSVCAAHYNHCLRGAESERDERFVLDMCAALGVECLSESGDVEHFAAVNGLGTEEAARIMRYDFLERAADRLGAETIATAHSADDNAETMLFALARGSGLKGLCGIPPRRGRIVRPMLGVTRGEIEAYLDSRGIAHVEDSTNAALDYSRNKIRALVTPVLRGINGEFALAAHRASRLLREDEEFLDSLASDFLAKYPSGKVDAAALAALSRSVASRVVRHMSPKSMSLKHVDSVLGIAEAGHGESDVPGARFRVESGRLYVVRESSAKLAEREVIIPGKTFLPEVGITLSAEVLEKTSEIHTSLNTFYFQYENICGTINCTPRRAGDRLRAVGRGCTKKLSDLFAEQGIPASERDLVPVLRDDKGVLAVVGFGQDERALPRGEGAVAVIRAKVEKDTIL